jgi:hypothetical protein
VQIAEKLGFEDNSSPFFCREMLATISVVTPGFLALADPSG